MRWSRPSTTWPSAQQLDPQVRERLVAVAARPPQGRRRGRRATSGRGAADHARPRRHVPRSRRGSSTWQRCLEPRRHAPRPGRRRRRPSRAAVPRPAGPCASARPAPRRQMPAVTRSGPQSQPKLQAILRIALNGWAFVCTRGCWSTLACSVAVSWAAKSTTSSVSPAPHQVGDVEPVGAVLVRAARRGRGRRGATSATVSSPSKTSSTCSPSSGAAVASVVAYRQLVRPIHCEAGLVLVEVRVGDQPGREQVGVDGAGHRRGDGTADDLLRRRSVQRQQGPSGEGLSGHFTAPAVSPATKWRCSEQEADDDRDAHDERGGHDLVPVDVGLGRVLLQADGEGAVLVGGHHRGEQHLAPGGHERVDRDGDDAGPGGRAGPRGTARRAARSRRPCAASSSSRGMVSK